MTADLKVPEFVENMHKVSEWDDVNAFLRAPQALMKRKIYRPSQEGILVNINGDDHLRRRQIESPMFNRAALIDYERHVLLPILNEYAARWRDRGRAELVNDTLLLNSRIGAKLTGLDGVTTDEQALELIDYTDTMAAANTVEWSKLPEEEQQAVIQAAMDARARFEASLLVEARSRREALLAQVADGRIDPSELPTDVITALLRNWNPDWKPELLSLEVLMFLSASIRTSMRAVCNTIQEIHDWMAAHPEDEDLRTDQAFIRGALSETLRLHTVTPLLLRMTSDEIALPSGMVIPKDEYVAVLHGRANRDPKVFGDDAAEFDPHRNQRMTKGRDYGVSFGSGAHACIGRRLAVGSGKDGSGSVGSVITIISRLLEMGVEPDPDDPAVPKEATYYDEYSRYPVRFTSA
jgi:cytochrome P450